MNARRHAGFACRACGGELRPGDGTPRWRASALRCADCDETIPVVDGIPRFPVPGGEPSGRDPFDRLAPIYETPLWFRPLYRAIGGPTAPPDDRVLLARMLEPDGRDALGDCRVLDVACGTGRFTRHVAGGAASVIGVDHSAEMLERARRYADRAGTGGANGTGPDGSERVAFARMSADRLWLADDAVDRAACCWALHLFAEPDAALAEVHRVMRDGGRFAGATLTDRYLLAAAPMRAGARHAIGAEPFAPAELHARLREAGFGEIEFDRRGAVLFFGARAE